MLWFFVCFFVFLCWFWFDSLPTHDPHLSLFVISPPPFRFPESIRQRRSVRPEVRKQEREKAARESKGKKEKKKNKNRAGARSAFKIPKNLRKSGRVNVGVRR